MALSLGSVASLLTSAATSGVHSEAVIPLKVFCSVPSGGVPWCYRGLRRCLGSGIKT